jgi:hypothetical protein
VSGQVNWCLDRSTGVWTGELVSGQVNWCLDRSTGVWTGQLVSGQVNWCLDRSTGVWTGQLVSGQVNWFSQTGLNSIQGSTWLDSLAGTYTAKKEKKIFLICREIQNGAVA